MFHTPHPDLNEEERNLLGIAPEECLRRAVQRGVLSLDQIIEDLTPHAAAVLRSIVTGERLPAPEPSQAEAPSSRETQPRRGPSLGAALYSLLNGEGAPEPSREEASSPPESKPADLPEVATARDALRQADYQSLGAWPGLQRAVDEGLLTASEALGVANAIDLSLGRYMTGILYAAP
jgi:hypothetical protein